MIITMIRKAFRSSAFIAFFALAMISGNAQEVRGKIDLNDERFKKLQERSRERSKGIMPQPSAYDEKNRNVLLNPEMPNCRDVSQYQIVDKSNIRILYAFNATDLTNPGSLTSPFSSGLLPSTDLTNLGSSSSISSTRFFKSQMSCPSW